MQTPPSDPLAHWDPDVSVRVSRVKAHQIAIAHSPTFDAVGVYLGLNTRLHFDSLEDMRLFALELARRVGDVVSAARPVEPPVGDSWRDT